MLEPDFSNWNKYNKNKVPEENRRVLFRFGSSSNNIVYSCLVVRQRETGYMVSNFGFEFWKDYSRIGDHWIYIDKIKIPSYGETMLERLKNFLTGLFNKIRYTSVNLEDDCAGCPFITTLNIKMLDGCDDLIPTKAHADDAGFDLKANVPADQPYVIRSGDAAAISVGFSCELEKGFELQVRPRSGLSIKNRITVANAPGTVDCNYRGEVKVILYNFGIYDFEVKRGDRIAQAVVNKLPSVKIQKVTELSGSDRGSGGFGSSGV